MKACINSRIIYTLLIFLFCQSLWAQNEKIVREIRIEGNKKTKPEIILRELTFKKGDTLMAESTERHLDQSRRNILNLLIFNFCSITESNDTFTIKVAERWYIWPIPDVRYIDRNFNVWWKSRDLTRINIGVNLSLYNLRGRNETLIANVTAGYTNKIGLDYRIPYLTKKLRTGLRVYAFYSQQREIWYNTENNVVKFYRDEASRWMLQQVEAGASLKRRPKIFTTGEIFGSYRFVHIADTVASAGLNPDFLLKGVKQNEYSAGAKITVDKRNYRGYPLKGSYFQQEISGTLISASGASKPMLVSRTRYNRYGQIARNLYWAAGSSMKISTLEELPYTNRRAFGYGYDYVRGYELYVIDGPHFGLLKTAVKFPLLQSKMRIPLMTNETFRKAPIWIWFSTFCDAGYVAGPTARFSSGNTLPNEALLGYGFSLDAVAFHDRVLRIEFTFNNSGRKGIYIHFLNAII